MSVHSLEVKVETKLFSTDAPVWLASSVSRIAVRRVLFFFSWFRFVDMHTILFDDFYDEFELALYSCLGCT